MDDGPTTLWGALARAADRYGDRVALVHEHRETSYRDLHARAAALAGKLRSVGVGRGDHAVVWMPNRLEWIVSFYALAQLGAVSVSCNTRYRSHELGYILRQSRATTLLMADGFPAAGVDLTAILADVTPAGAERTADGGIRWPDLPDLERILVAGERLPDGASEFPDVTGTTAEPAALDAAAPDDAAHMVYTSGTTGHPKGCLLSHRALLTRAWQRTRFFAWDAEDCFLATMPYFHIAGAIGPIVGSTLRGSRQVVLDLFDPLAAMTLIERHRVTILSGVPTMFSSILDHPRRAEFDLSSLRSASLGSTTIPEALIRRVSDPAEGLGMTTVVMYGLTEACGSTHVSAPDDGPAVRAQTVGVAVPGIEDRIEDPATGRPVPTGQVGEICVRGSGLMLGYYDMPEATAEKMRGGWLHTGDLGTRDETGHVRVAGRLDDTISVGGFNTYPAEIEHVLRDHPAVRDAAVVGIPDTRLGQAVAAFVVPEGPVAADTAADIIAFARARIANFKVPRRVEFVSEFPTTASGKVQRYVLRTRAQDLAGSPAATEPVAVRAERTEA